MGEIRLYRKIYCISNRLTSVGNVQSYNLIDPNSLTSNCYIAGSGSTESNILIESDLKITKESTGIYYVDLNPLLYSTDNTYDLVWYIEYVNNAPIKKLTTRFRLNNQSRVSNEITFEIFPQNIEIEILNDNLEIQIN